jgi:hypothetical protein
MDRKKLILALAGAAGLYFLLRRQGRRWGATEGEIQAQLPGDELLPHAMEEWTNAITIHAPAVQVWPWLVQMGQGGRAGWYTDSWLSPLEHRFWQLVVPPQDRAEGPFRPSARRLIPKLQDLNIGDRIPDGPPDSAYFIVKELEPARHLVLWSDTHIRYMTPSFLRGKPRWESYGEWTWAFVLQPRGEGGTRLLLRTRANYGPPVLKTFSLPLVYAANLINTRAMLRGIKARAEGEYGELWFPAARAGQGVEGQGHDF